MRRWNYISKCWEHAQHHWLVAVVATIALILSLWTEYVEPLVDVPEIKLTRKLPLPWALVIALVCLAVILIEGGVRLHNANKEEWDKEKARILWEKANVDQQLKRALETPSGPELAIYRGSFPNHLMIKNLRGGTAHGVVMHPFRNGMWTVLEHKIDFLQEGKYEDFLIEIQGDSGAVPGGELKFEMFLEAADRARPLEEKTLSAEIPVTLTYWDGLNKDFVCRYELQYKILTKEIAFPLLKRDADLRG